MKAELQFDKAKWTTDSEGTWLSIRACEDRQKVIKAAAQIKEKKYVAEIKEYREKRSLDANAYCWVLIDKLAEKLGIGKIELYREIVKEIGGNSYIYPIKAEAVDAYIRHWGHNGLGWIAEPMGDSKIDGYVNVISYYGSSEYDTAQMSRLIDLVVAECKEQDIETLTPAQLAGLKETWR